MTAHDPLCPRTYYDDPDVVVCLCPEFSAVRQDESVKATARVRAQIAADIERTSRLFSEALRKGIGNRPLSMSEIEFERGISSGMDTSARIARGES